MAKKTTSIVEINEESFHSFVYQFRGVPVMLDSDLAEIYGYTTKGFNRQVKNNFERFDEEDFMFQLTQDEKQLKKVLLCLRKHLKMRRVF